MALQLGNFKPSQAQHYTLAETQDEKNAANARQANLIAQQGLNSLASANAHAAGQIALQGPRLAEEARQADMRDAQAGNSLNATVAQQGAANDLAQQGVDLKAQELQQKQQASAAALAQQGVTNQLAQSQEARLQGADQRQNTLFEQQQADRKIAEEKKQNELALAKFGSYLNTVKPDDKGLVDVTDQKDNIKTLAGGFGDVDYKKITAQNIDGKTQLYGTDADGNAQPLTRNGNQISIDNKALQMFSMFGQDSAKAKAQAELEQTQLENKTKQTQLDYMTKNGVQMGTAGQENNKVTTTANRLGGAFITQSDSTGVTTTPVGIDGKVGTPIKIAAPGVTQKAPQSTQQQLPPGTKRVINGTPAVWDGAGWKADK